MVISVIDSIGGDTRCIHSRIIEDTNAGEEVCQSCGQIVLEKSESYLEPPLEKDEYFHSSRTGHNTSLAFYGGLSTVINKENVDALGKKISSDMKTKYHRLRIWDARSKAQRADLRLRNGLIILDGIKGKLSLSDNVVERIAYLYRKSIVSHIFGRKKTSDIIATCTYVGCKLEKLPRSLNEIASVTNVHKDIIYKNTDILTNGLGLKISPLHAQNFLPKLTSAVNMSLKTQRYAMQILQELEKKQCLEGKNPLVTCCVVSWIAAAKTGESMTQQEFAEAAGVSTVSIRNNLKYILKVLKK